MTRYIDADALEKAINEWMPKNQEELMASSIPLIENLAVSLLMTTEEQPTVDAVPVIRCKDCKHWYEKYRHGVDMSACKRTIGYFGANDYCSRAERKEEP